LADVSTENRLARLPFSFQWRPVDRHNVLRAFRHVVETAALDPRRWTPRELRHSFVSLLSDSGVSLEGIADLCGHSGTTVTETVYRHQLKPVLLNGAVTMDRIFGVETPPGA
jgi:integrase